MIKAPIFRIMAVLLLAPAGFVAAHHGTAGFYDEHKKVKVEGVVKEFHWRNPHSGLFVVGKDSNGNEGTFALEMGSPSSLARAGYTRRTVKPGDKVVAEVRPAHTNPLAGELISSDLWVNGKRVSTMISDQGKAKSEE
jgi:Family of unknown function (DUF6152)